MLQWESFKAALHLSAKPMKLQRVGRSSSVACVDRKSGIEACLTDVLHPHAGVRRNDNFTLADYTPQVLAEQLTLIQQVSNHGITCLYVTMVIQNITCLCNHGDTEYYMSM